MKCFHFSLSACLLVLLLCAGGCAEKKAPSPEQAGVASDASEAAVAGDQNVYTFAPGAYVIHIVSGEAVVLDSFVRDFPVFNSPDAARAFLKKEAAAGRLDESEWKIYRIYGTWAELAKPNPEGGHLLAKPAPLIDWVN